MNDLIYDLGMHQGEDSDFYLKKGFRVVAVEANPDLCTLVAERLACHADRLTIVNAAIAEKPGLVTFYKSQHSQWGTIRQEWAERNRKTSKAESEAITVPAMPFEELLARHGEAYFVKIDIEGMDHIALEALSRSDHRPKYLSIESDKVSFKRLRREFELFLQMGYDRFKVVQQRDVPKQTPPDPPREGRYADHVFPEGASGLFGEEAPGEWMSADEAIRRYRRIFWKYRTYGDSPIGGQLVRRLVWRYGIRPGWYDTHAKHSSA